MVNVNLEALTASLSAAVQQAVRSALTTASTSGGSPQRKDIVAQVPDVPENLVSQVVETEVSDLTNAGGGVQSSNTRRGPFPDCGARGPTAGEVVDNLKALLGSSISEGSKKTYQRAWSV